MVAQQVIGAATQYGDKIRSSVQLAADQSGQGFGPTPDRYALNEAYYANAAYEQRTRGTVNRANLPRNLRSVLALVKPAVDWWPGHLYPGVWTRDGRAAGNGRGNRVAYDEGTPEEVRLAGQTALGWGGWDRDILVYALHGAMLGEVFAEVKVDWVRGKVYPVLHHPRTVRDLAWDDSGNLTMYHLVIPQRDGQGHAYLWGMRVDKETIRTFRDDTPHGYDGEPAAIPNPWGFVPGVWVQHRNVGGQHGSSVMDGLHPIVDELNGMQSAVDDFVMRFVRQQVVVSSKDPKGLGRFLKTGSYDDKTLYDDFMADTRRRMLGEKHDDDVTVLPAPEGTTVQRMLANLGVGESAVHFDRILQVLERNLPEVVLSEKLLGMTHVTAPGVRPLLQDVQHKLDDAVANYDGGVVKLVQMCLSIGGELARQGYWGPRSGLSRQQQTFLPFDLSSWDRGDLDFSIQPRDLLRPTTLDLAAEAKIVEGLTSSWGLLHAGLDPTEIYGTVGGVVQAPDPADAPGILDQRATVQSTAAGLFGQAFNTGGGA